MVIDIKAAGALAEENHDKRIAAFGSPAMAIDNSFKILCKTVSVNEFLTGVRRGSKIARFLTEKAIFDIERISPHNILHTQIQTSKGMRSIAVIGGNGYRLIVFRPIYNDVIDGINRLYNRMSGYDGSVFGEIESTESAFAKFEIIDSVLKGLQTIRGLPFFDASNLMNCISKSLDEISEAPKTKIKFNKHETKLITNGNERDYAALVIFALYGCFHLGNKTEVTLSEQSGETVLRIMSDFQLNSEPKINLSKYLPSSEGEQKFLWLYLIKLIADANLWDFEILSNLDGRTVLELRSMLYKNGEEFMFREDELDFIADFIKTFFG